MPPNPHGLEYSIRDGALFCSVYPDYKLRSESLVGFLGNLYKASALYKEWRIEKEITKEINEKYMPITKGFCSENKMRKIFFGCRSDLSNWGKDKVAHAVLDVEEFLNPEIELNSLRSIY